MTLKSSEPDLVVTKNSLFYCENSSHVAPLTQTTYYNSELETGQIIMCGGGEKEARVQFIQEGLNKKESEKPKKETPDYS